MDYIAYWSSPLGELVMSSDGEALTGLSFADGNSASRLACAGLKSEKPPVFELTERWLEIYFSGRIPDFSPPLSLTGTPFRMAVWELLRRIPYGRTKTYGEIAGELARLRGLKAMAAQAVGGAAGRNPIALIVPCHRVVGAGGRLVGYAAGIRRKQALLELEAETLAALGQGGPR